MVVSTAEVLRVSVDALHLHPVADFKVADDHRASALGDGNRIAHVVAVAVRDQNEIGLHIFRRDRRRRVAGEERIHEQLVLADL
jgi:hypothetical protein